MANNKDIKKDKPKKEKKKRKPVYEIQGFVLTIPEERLKKLCLLDWNEINKSQRHSFGYEKISIKSIKKDISIAKGIDYLFSFRATGSNHVFLGFREGNVF